MPRWATSNKFVIGLTGLLVLYLYFRGRQSATVLKEKADEQRKQAVSGSVDRESRIVDLALLPKELSDFAASDYFNTALLEFIVGFMNNEIDEQRRSVVSDRERPRFNDSCHRLVPARVVSSTRRIVGRALGVGFYFRVIMDRFSGEVLDDFYADVSVRVIESAEGASLGMHVLRLDRIRHSEALGLCDDGVVEEKFCVCTKSALTQAMMTDSDLEELRLAKRDDPDLLSWREKLWGKFLHQDEASQKLSLSDRIFSYFERSAVPLAHAVSELEKLDECVAREERRYHSHWKLAVVALNFVNKCSTDRAVYLTTGSSSNVVRVNNFNDAVMIRKYSTVFAGVIVRFAPDGPVNLAIKYSV